MSTVNQKSDPFNGHCAFAVSIGKMDVDGGKYPLTLDGKTYTFSNKPVRFLFKYLPALRKKAHNNWDERQLG